MHVNVRADLAWPIARSNKWTAVVVLGGGALLAAWIAGGSAVDRARLAIVLLGLGAAQVLDDPVTDLVHASPTPYVVVRSWRLVFGLAPLAAGWIMVLVALPLSGVRHALSLELLAMVAWVVALAAVAARLSGGGDGEGGPEAAAAVAALAAGRTLLPPRWTLARCRPGRPAVDGEPSTLVRVVGRRRRRARGDDARSAQPASLAPSTRLRYSAIESHEQGNLSPLPLLVGA